MHFLFINRLAGSLLGGGENFIFRLIEHLTKQGHSAELVTARPVFNNGLNLSLPAKIHTVRSPFLRYSAMKYRLPYPFPALGIMMDFYLFALLSARLLKRLLTTQKFDVIVLTGFPKFGSRLQRRFRIPVVVRMPGPPSKREEKYLDQVSAVIANGDAYNQLQRAQAINPEINLFHVPLGVDEIFFQRIDKEERLIVKKNLGLEHKRIILFVGRLNTIKNIPMLLEAFKRVITKQKDAVLLLVGDGEEKQNIQRRIHQLDMEDAVRLVGAQYGNDLARYYKIADLFVLSSKYDNYPQVINEAMAAGLPVVATDVGGVFAQVHDGETGYLISPGDTGLFAQRVIELLKDSNKRILFSTRAREAVKNLTWKSASEEFLKIVRQLKINNA